MTVVTAGRLPRETTPGIGKVWGQVRPGEEGVPRDPFLVRAVVP
ncbi:hypothetical protein QMZ92_21775 [Streptomyces sp. HNM0645]|nr:hypothetical protein [Streptomyces sp. HNM0645]MDI9886925.1 hypothetical protein [Streptomyces sp. HNM0645]